MFYFGQEAWNWLVAVYLFLGGMGAMVMDFNPNASFKNLWSRQYPADDLG
jgi:formate-dependent nitrite reductase membrane component NrfD